MSRPRWIALVFGLALAALCILMLEGARRGIPQTALQVGTTPVTLYGAGDGPVVVVAHGFGGSRPLMQAISLSLARVGYRVAAFDFEGHGANPVPMSGDVTAIDGTTARLVRETTRVIDAVKAQAGSDGSVALVGHSMATDVIIRAARPRDDVAAMVAISMYSEAVTAEYPARLLIVSGQFEPHLRRAALDALHLVDPAAREGETARRGNILRRAVVAPMVEHVGVLYAPATLRETLTWLDAAFGRETSAPPVRLGGPLAGVIVALVLLVWPACALLRRAPRPATPSRGTFLAALVIPGLAAAAVTGLVPVALLPVLVSDALALHLLVMGGLQLLILGRSGLLPRPSGRAGLALLLVWGLLVFGAALDRYGAQFRPIPERLPIIALLALGTLPYMLADAVLTQAGRASVWRRIAARAALFLSLGLAVVMDPARLLFIAAAVPVLVLFFLVHGTMGRWVGQRSGPFASGIGLGLILAWVLGVAFPLFSAA